MIIVDEKYEFTFGKYKGLSLPEVLAEDPWYIVWCSENVKTIQFKEEILKDAKLHVNSNHDFSHNSNWGIVNGY
jgi:hypothetical protein